MQTKAMIRAYSSLVGRLTGAVIVVLASVTLAAVALHGWRLHRMAGAAQVQVLRAVATLGATQLAERSGGAKTDEAHGRELAAEFQRWSWAALRQPQVLATALRDQQGRVRQFLPPDIKLDSVLASLPPGEESVSPAELEVGGHSNRVWVMAVSLDQRDDPASSGSVVVLARRTPSAWVWGRWALTFVLPVIGVAAISFALVLRWMGQRVGQPLRGLIRGPYEEESRWRARLPVKRDDELGGIARSTDEALAELADVRAQLEKMRRGLHLRVAERTREINHMLKDAQRKVWIDPLTQLGNRRLLDDRLEELFDAQRDSGGDLCVAMFDVDHFKEHNDTLGHAAGDDLLRFLGQLLRGSLRETDVGIRYAGDEFVVLLPDVEPDNAVALANRVARLFAQHTSVFETQPRPTLSAGVSSLRRCGATSGEDLLRWADRALYEAKNRGKNNVRLAASRSPVQRQPVANPCPR